MRTGIRQLIKKLNFRKPSVWIIIILVLLVASLSTVLTLRPAAKPAVFVKTAAEAKADMTLDDVRALVRKGNALTFTDFSPFLGGDASSRLNYHITLYGVEKRYRLIVRTDGKTIDAANLESIWESGGTGIDIRTGNIDRFVAEHPSSPAPAAPIRLVPVAAAWLRDQTVGVDMAFLDYASDDVVIFHGYFGLFVFDLHTQKFLRTLNTQVIGCDVSQGDSYCEVSVSPDGNTVQLHPMSSNRMFVYTVSDGTLYETTYQPMEHRFPNTVSTDSIIASQSIGTYSYRAVTFGQDDYAYLRTADWTLGTLTYVRSQTEYKLFTDFSSATANGTSPGVDFSLDASSRILLSSATPSWSPDQKVDVILSSLDYASNDIVIFHGLFGLFVYDLHAKQLIRSVDLTPLSCQWTQGSDACEVSVSTDGSTIYLHPMNNKNMFVYSVSDDALYLAANQPMEQRFSSTVPTEEVMPLGPVSPRVVAFETGEYGYLYSSDWTLGKLTYIRGNAGYPLFK